MAVYGIFYTYLVLLLLLLLFGSRVQSVFNSGCTYTVIIYNKIYIFIRMYLYQLPRIMCDVLYFILFMRMHIGRYVFHLCTRSRTVRVVEKALLIPHTYIVNSVCINIDICTHYTIQFQTVPE